MSDTEIFRRGRKLRRAALDSLKAAHGVLTAEGTLPATRRMACA